MTLWLGVESVANLTNLLFQNWKEIATPLGVPPMPLRRPSGLLRRPSGVLPASLRRDWDWGDIPSPADFNTDSLDMLPLVWAAAVVQLVSVRADLLTPVCTTVWFKVVVLILLCW